MLILVGVTVTTAINGGLFESARKAANGTTIAKEKEELQSAVAASYNVETDKIDKVELSKNLGTKWKVEGTEVFTCSTNENTFTVSEKGEIIEINDDVISKILNQYFDTGTEESITQLKKLLSISDAIWLEDTIGFIDSIDNDENVYVYIYKIDRIYKASYSKSGDGIEGDGIEEFAYADKEQNLKAYNFARKFKAVKADIDNVFKGKTKKEMAEQYENGTLEASLISDSENINSIKFSKDSTR